MPPLKYTLLCVEDDPMIRETLREMLVEENFSVHMATNLAEARKLLSENKYDGVLLDVSLPDGRSFELCNQLREDLPSLPIIIVTASVDEETAVRGLSQGATDFVRKPFGKKELLQRIRNLMKNKRGRLSAGNVVLELESRKVKVAKKEMKLTPSEFTLLTALVRQAGEALSVDQILDALGDEGELGAAGVRTHVSRLRAKLAKADAEGLAIVSVHGWGYRLEKKAA